MAAHYLERPCRVQELSARRVPSCRRKRGYSNLAPYAEITVGEPIGIAAAVISSNCCIIGVSPRHLELCPKELFNRITVAAQRRTVFGLA